MTRFAWIGLLALLLGAGPQDTGPIPAPVTVTLDDGALAETGSFVFKLRFTPGEAIPKPYSITLEVRTGGRTILRRNHTPRPPTLQWKKGTPVAYDVEAVFPLDADLKGAGDTLDLYLGFYDSKTRRTRPPKGGSDVTGGLARVGTMRTPKFAPTTTEEALVALIERARAARKEGRGPTAWNMLETALRLSTDDPIKKRLGAVMMKIGDYDSPAISPIEAQIVKGRIEAEKRRYLRTVSGRMFDRKEFAGALRILQIIGGELQEQAESAVIGAVDEATRAQKDITRVEMALLKHITPEDKKIVEADLEKYGLTETLFKRANRYVEREKFAIARHLLDEIARNTDGELQKKADVRLAELEPIHLKYTPPEERAKVDAAINHPVWERTTTSVSHRFIFIGPTDLVSTIPAPSKLRFDVAYVFLTDFFGRKPNPTGDRVTVFYKELWNFGGATGGGTQINVGNAKPDARGTRVDTGLYYHELTHCIDDFRPGFAGFAEGLAELGVAFALEAVGNERASKGAIRRYLDAFKKDYLDRDLDYWRIQKYAPSAGFFVHFMDKYGKSDTGYVWQRYRRFFRAYRSAPFRDGREPDLIRSLAFYLMLSFGRDAFDDLVSFRLPLTPADREAIEREMEIYARGLRPLRVEELESFSNTPNAPAVRDTGFYKMLNLGRSASDEEVRAYSREKLGIIHDWIVTGPFAGRGADPDVFVYPPEYEIDFSKEYQGGGHLCRWMRPDPAKPVRIDPTGWVEFRWAYRDNSAFYALCYVVVDRDIDAFAHFRCDDDGTLFVNDELIVKYRTRGANSSTAVGWRGPRAKVPDGMRRAIKLRAGRNKVLLKVKNRRGDSGFIFAITDAHGRPIPGLKVDTEGTAAAAAVGKERTSWKTILECQKADRRMAAAFKSAVGGYTLKKDRLVGKANDKRVPWRMYTVRPGFPKDSPSNLAWFRGKLTRKLTDFRLDLAVDTANNTPPKFCITFEGEGNNDPLSGWSVTLVPSGRDKVVARVERYNRLVYVNSPTKVTMDKGPVAFHLLYERRRLTVKFGESILFDKIPIRPVPGNTRLGLTTWDGNTRFAGLVLRAAKTKK